jgi:D-serine deaminase-like pyridoxal phosphate-dependent protein
VSERRRETYANAAALSELGLANSRHLIPTPALLCDRALLGDNISSMAEVARTGGVALRPHVKSHKCAFIARLQLEAGASGLSCAKLSEAEAIVDALLADGYDVPLSILLTSPFAGRLPAERAAALAKRCDLHVVVDHVDGVDELARAADATSASLSVLCDVDVGLGRTGVLDGDEALGVVDRVITHPQLHFAGVQGYGGHLQHISGREHRRVATIASMDRFANVIRALEARGYRVPLRTGGGTGTAAIDIELGVLNELQTGSYVFMDREYRDALGGDPEGHFAQSLTLLTTVISTNQEGFVTVDAGLKSMSTDAGVPVVVGHEATSTYSFFGDEQGLVTTAPGHTFVRGQRIELVPPHCDPTVDRYDVIWMVHDDIALELIDVSARGCSQ